MLKTVRTAVISLLITLLAASSVSAQQEEREDFRPAVTEGIRLYQLKKVEEAISAIKNAIAEDPGDAVAHNALGVIYSQEGDFDKALEEFDKAISLRDPYYKAIYNKFNLLLSSGRAEEAEALLKDVIQRHPDHIDGYINLGVLAGRRGDNTSAFSYFDKAIELSPDDFDAFFKKGQLLVVEKRYEEALSCFNRALDIEPRLTSAAQAARLVDEILQKKQQGFIRIRQIFVPDGEVAQRIKAELDNGADFAALAVRYSADPSAKFGGDLGFVSRGDLMPEIEEVIFSLDVGQVSAIVRSPRGFHIFKREE